jgi:transcriptional regulator with XRE-family HTH domain
VTFELDGKGFIPPAAAKTVGERIAWLRMCFSRGPEKAPITKRDFAELSHVGEGTIKDIEAGDRVPLPQTLEKICEALKVPVRLLTVSQEKWLEVVTGAGLQCRPLNGRRTSPKPRDCCDTGAQWAGTFAERRRA